MAIKLTTDEYINLFENPRFLLARAGGFAVFASQRHFEIQGFDSPNDWPERYPAQDDPAINIAAALVRFGQGKSTLPSRTFEKRPALIGIGDLRNRIAIRTLEDDSVEIGNTLPYAEKHQKGGFTTIPVTDTSKKSISKFLVGGPQFTQHLSPFLQDNVTEHTQRIEQRKYLGMSQSDRSEMIVNLERSIQVEIKGRV